MFSVWSWISVLKVKCFQIPRGCCWRDWWIKMNVFINEKSFKFHVDRVVKFDRHFCLIFGFGSQTSSQPTVYYTTVKTRVKTCVIWCMFLSSGRRFWWTTVIFSEQPGMPREGHPLFLFSSFVFSLLSVFAVVSFFLLCRRRTVKKKKNLRQFVHHDVCHVSTKGTFYL